MFKNLLNKKQKKIEKIYITKDSILDEERNQLIQLDDFLEKHGKLKKYIDVDNLVVILEPDFDTSLLEKLEGGLGSIVKSNVIIKSKIAELLESIDLLENQKTQTLLEYEGNIYFYTNTNLVKFAQLEEEIESFCRDFFKDIILEKRGVLVKSKTLTYENTKNVPKIIGVPVVLLT